MKNGKRYCQSKIEGRITCKVQCKHCALYYYDIEIYRTPRKLKKLLNKINSAMCGIKY